MTRMTKITGMTWMTRMTRMTGKIRMTGMTRITGMPRMTGKTRVTRMTNMTGLTNMTEITEMTKMTNMTNMTGVTGKTKLMRMTGMTSITRVEIPRTRIAHRLGEHGYCAAIHIFGNAKPVNCWGVATTSQRPHPCYDTFSTIQYRSQCKTCKWNPKFWAFESRIKLKESGILLTFGIRNLSSTGKDSGYPVPGIWILLCGIQNPRRHEGLGVTVIAVILVTHRVISKTLSLGCIPLG